MAVTTTQVLTATPAALKNGAAEIAASTWYSVQCKGNKKFYVQTANSAPGDSTGAFVIGQGAIISVNRSGNEHVYVWQDDIRSDGEFSTLVVEQYTA